MRRSAENRLKRVVGGTFLKGVSRATSAVLFNRCISRLLPCCSPLTVKSLVFGSRMVWLTNYDCGNDKVTDDSGCTNDLCQYTLHNFIQIFFYINITSIVFV